MEWCHVSEQYWHASVLSVMMLKGKFMWKTKSNDSTSIENISFIPSSHISTSSSGAHETKELSKSC